MRATGSWTDQLRRTWRSAVGSRPRLQGLDDRAHRLYAQVERLRFGVTLMADLPSFRAYRRVESRRAGREPAHVRVRPLGGATIELRPGTTDALNLRDTFRDRIHPPPPEIERRGVRHIVDLGANIGLTAAHNAYLHPEAHVLAVELDAGSAEIASRNCATWGDRCQVLQGAVWLEDGEVPYVREGLGEHGFHVAEPASSSDTTPVTRAMSMDTVLSHIPDGERVDYVKMDVQGLESRLLRGEAGRWSERVDAIGVLVWDEGYSLEACARDLAALGFEPRLNPHRRSYMVGVRPEATSR